jgi:Domain of unknown function (DUF4279)
MAVHQYAYFALFSRTIPATAMTARLGVEPDETAVRGSRRPGPDAVPVHHRWMIVCREPELCVDEQVACLMRRLVPHTAAIAGLARQLNDEGDGSGAVLEIVRYFDDRDGPDLFGWHLDRTVLDFLHATGADLDVDEYDLTAGD